MDSRKIMLLVGALVVAALAAFMARSLVSGTTAPTASAAAPAPVDGPEVLVATRALPVGTIIDPTALKFQAWPKELVVGNAYFLKRDTNVEKLQGTVVRHAITAGEPLTQGALVHPGDRGFLAAALGPGMRAVTVPVSANTAVAGFVFPGDRVDLVLTQTVAGGGDGPPLKVSETVLRNLRILATDQRTDNTTNEDGKTVVRTFSSVTVEATPKLAEKLAVVQTLGTLSLSLRSLADNGSELEEAIASGDVKMPENGDRKAEEAVMKRVATLPVAGKTSFATGGDVSRFQRSTVPAKASGDSASPMLGPQGGGAPAVSGSVDGPVVRVARGNSVTLVPVGGKN